jgi:hypothetical protein
MTEPTLENILLRTRSVVVCRVKDNDAVIRTTNDPAVSDYSLTDNFHMRQLIGGIDELLKAYAERKPEACIECKNAIGYGWCTICDGEKPESPEAEACCDGVSCTFWSTELDECTHHTPCTQPAPIEPLPDRYTGTLFEHKSREKINEIIERLAEGE